jgi:hypothetical protein
MRSEGKSLRAIRAALTPALSLGAIARVAREATLARAAE